MVSARGIRAGAAYVELVAHDGKLTSGLRKASAKLKAFSKGIQHLGMSMIKASAVMAAPFALAARTFAGFSDQMAQVKAVTGATEQEFQKLTDLAKELGRTTSFTAQEVADGMTSLGRAGYKSSQILAAIPDVLNLARGTATDLGLAADIAAAAMRGFGLSADDTTRIADVLTATANNSAQTLTELGEAMKYVAPLAMEAGESIEDVSAAIGVLANNGIKGSMAGTALARAYKNLSTGGAQKKLAELGVTAVDQQGNLRKLADIMSDLGEKSKNMGSGKKLATFESLFGRGQAAALKLAAPTADFGNLQETLKNAAGTAKRTAETMDDTLGGSFRKMMSAVEGVQIAIGEALSNTLRKYMGYVAKASERVTQLVIANKDLIIGAVKIIAVIGAVGAVFVALGTAGSIVAFVFGGIASIISLAGTAVGIFGAALAALLSPIALVVAGVVGLGGYILYATGIAGDALDWLSERFVSLKEYAQQVAGGIADALAANNISLAARILWLTLRVEFEKGVSYLNALWETVYLEAANAFDLIAVTVVEVFDTVYTAAKNAMDSVYKVVLGVAETISKTFWSAIQGIVDSFAYLLDKISTAGYALHIIDDDEITAMDKAIKRMREGAKGFTDKQKGRAKALYGDEIDESTKQQAQNSSALEDRSAVRREQLSEREEARNKEYFADLSQAEKNLSLAKQEWQSAMAEVKEPPATPTVDTSGEQPLIEKVKASLSKVTETVSQSRNIDVSGTFNAAAIRGLETTGVAERTAKAAEDTAKNTKKLLNEAKDGGLVFG